jgi:hypothetical protein
MNQIIEITTYSDLAPSVNGLLVQPCSSLHAYSTRYPASILIEVVGNQLILLMRADLCGALVANSKPG